MIWYIKNWHRFSADNKMSLAVGVLILMYSGYLLYVLVFPQYVNVVFHKSLALFMLAVVAYGGHLMTKGFRTIEKLEKRTKEINAEIAIVQGKTAVVNEKSQMLAQTFAQLTGDMDQMLGAIVSSAENRKNSADIEKSDAAFVTLLKQFNAKQQEVINFIKDANRSVMGNSGENGNN